MNIYATWGIVWRLWRVHGTLTLSSILWYYLKARLTGVWEPWLWATVPIVGRVALDVGANTGQWTFKLAEQFGEVIAIEPHPGSANKLRAKAPYNVRVVEGAAWDLSEWKKLVLYPDPRFCRITPHDLLFSMGMGRKDGVNVLCFPIDALKLDRVDFIKMDVEGAEAEALEGATRTIRASSPVILVELHSTLARERIEAQLTSLGYSWEYKHYPFYRPGDKLEALRLWMLARKE